MTRRLLSTLFFLSSILVLAAFARPGASAGAEWQRAKGPLETRWAGEVSPQNALPEYPRPQMARKDWLSLNGLWQLEIAGARAAGADAPSGKDLPERILVPFPIESALSGVMKRAERAWYRRTFEVPGAWAGKRILIHFGAVDWEAAVHVNGKLLGTHRGGYDSFSFDVTEALRPSGPQEIVVGVFDPTDKGDQPRGKQVNNPGGIFYTPATGIWQTVWLEPVPAASIASLTITPDVDGGRLRLAASVTEAAKDLEVLAVTLEDEREVARAAGRPGSEISLALKEPKLWSPDRPFLYGLRVSLRKGSETVDSVDSYFGMRKIEVARDGKVQRLLLNGKFVFQIGPLDQGFWPDGIYTAPTDEALRYDLEITKKLGLNTIRKHVKIEPERWYYWADKLGLLIWQDMPSGNNSKAESRKQFELELERMVLQHRNHPSIIMWVVFNEGWGQYDTPRLTAWVKAMDPGRLVNNASGWTDQKVGDVIDMHNYPGPGSPKPEATRAAVLGEFGGLGLKIDGHTWQKETWGYQGMADTAQLTRRYVQLLQKVWGLAEDPGLCAAIYTQTTDVETECNGLLTYDRAIVKPVLEKVSAANRGDIPVIEIKEVVPTSKMEGIEWRYVTEAPPKEWVQPGFDDSGWKKGPAGFGAAGTPGAVVRTEWKTGEIWLRRTFTIGEVKTEDLSFIAHHDEDVEIYLNGVPAAKAGGYTTAYEELPMTAEGKAALKKGENTVAVRCKQTGGGQYIDVGIALVTEKPAK